MISTRKKHRLILCNDGGPLLGPNIEAPVGANGLEKLVLEPLDGTQVDTLFWQIGTDPYKSTPTHRLTGWYSHRTDIGPRWGDGMDAFNSAGMWRIYENTRNLIEQGTDPLEVIVERGHKRGLDVFASMRVNDIHDGFHMDGDPPFFSPTKLDHPEWLLGPVYNPEPESRYKGLSRYALNFAVWEVRDYALAMATETIDNYNVDGLEWDFCRFPRLFPEGAARDNAQLMTTVIGSLREALDRKGEQQGRRLELAVRVPPTIELAAAFGLDVEEWIRRGLIDILIAGVVHGNLHRVPVESFVQAAKDTGVQVIAQNPGFFRLGRPNSAKVLWGETGLYSDEMCRATAAAHWQAGADGVYLWNNQLIEFNHSVDYDARPWREVGSPDTLIGKDKHYVVDSPADWDTMRYELGAPAVPQGPLPQSLASEGDSAEVSVDIADDVGTGTTTATLRVLIVNLTNRDTVVFTLNGIELGITSASIALNYDDCWLDFDVSGGPIRRGWNTFVLKVKERNRLISAPLSLASVEVLVRYPQQC
jgi:hypothetical protein